MYQFSSYTDTVQGYKVFFDPRTGMKVRTGILDSKGRETGEEPFQAQYPELIDIGVMETCRCSKLCKLDCYQQAINRTGENMRVSDFRWLIEQSRGKTFQVALGGAGDPDTHEHFEELLKICAENNIVPNFTTSGICLTQASVELAKRYCGVVAVSEHNTDYTERAIRLLVGNGIKTNVHYVLNRDTIDQATRLLMQNEIARYQGVNAIVFLLYKPIGLGKQELVLQPTDPKVQKFFEAFDRRKVPYKIGFDSCTSAALVNFSKRFDARYIDYCEGARFSMYIDARLNAMACSFLNGRKEHHRRLNPDTGYGIKEAWNSEEFCRFRKKLKTACPACSKRSQCGGGCPIASSVTLCKSGQRTTKGEELI